MKIPNHIAIIMDGNSRWGVKKRKNVLYGHQEGTKNIKPILKFCIKNKVKNLTLYALSCDNYKKRSASEIKNIFNLLEKYLTANINYFYENKIALKFIGSIHELPKKISKIIHKSEVDTNNKNKKLLLNIAFNYSSRKEIIDTFNKLKFKKIKITEKIFARFIPTFESKDPEIIIRTGGYKRMSDFLLWQSSYSELFFLKKLWPDFETRDLRLIIQKYNNVERKFGS